MSRINVFWGAEETHGETGSLLDELGKFDQNLLSVGERIGAKYEGIGDKKIIEFPGRRPALPPSDGQR